MGLRHVFNPELFQGAKRKDRYFEGWYFKMVTKDLKHSIALIPGVSLNKKDPHLFIQVFVVHHVDEPTLKTDYIRYPYVSDFFDPQSFLIRVGSSIFSKNYVDLNLTGSMVLKGRIQWEDMTPIHQSIGSPNIMGFFGYFGFMECYHGVLSMNHRLDGTLVIDEIPLDFSGGKGYMEKDWGVSFPKEYVWMQTNHFDRDDVSLMFSYAQIPFLGFHFKGLISVFMLHGKEYRFATYNFSRVIKEILSDNMTTYHIKKGRLRLELIAKTDRSVDLISPKYGLMNETIKEGLSGSVAVKLWHKNRLIYSGVGIRAGIEIMKKSR